MTLTHRRCPYGNGKSIEAQRTDTMQCGAPRTLYHCFPCARSFSETHHTPIALVVYLRDIYERICYWPSLLVNDSTYYGELGGNIRFLLSLPT
jgi:hypothetical protein